MTTFILVLTALSNGKCILAGRTPFKGFEAFRYMQSDGPELRREPYAVTTTVTLQLALNPKLDVALAINSARYETQTRLTVQAATVEALLRPRASIAFEQAPAAPTLDDFSSLNWDSVVEACPVSPDNRIAKIVPVLTPTQALQELTAPGHILFIGKRVCTQKHGACDLTYRPAMRLNCAEPYAVRTTTALQLALNQKLDVAPAISSTGYETQRRLTVQAASAEALLRPCAPIAFEQAPAAPTVDDFSSLDWDSVIEACPVSPDNRIAKIAPMLTPTQALQGLTAPGHILFIGKRVCTQKHGARDLTYRPAIVEALLRPRAPIAFEQAPAAHTG